MRRTGPSSAAWALVKARDGGVCLYCQARFATETHHRIGRGMGGSRRAIVNDPSALVSLCQMCHHHFTMFPGQAYAFGWSVRRNGHDLPSEIPLTDALGRVFCLTEEGEIFPVTGGGLLPEHPEIEAPF